MTRRAHTDSCEGLATTSSCPKQQQENKPSRPQHYLHRISGTPDNPLHSAPPQSTSASWILGSNVLCPWHVTYLTAPYNLRSHPAPATISPSWPSDVCGFTGHSNPQSVLKPTDCTSGSPNLLESSKGAWGSEGRPSINFTCKRP